MESRTLEGDLDSYNVLSGPLVVSLQDFSSPERQRWMAFDTFLEIQGSGETIFDALQGFKKNLIDRRDTLEFLKDLDEDNLFQEDENQLRYLQAIIIKKSDLCPHCHQKHEDSAPPREEDHTLSLLKRFRGCQNICYIVWACQNCAYTFVEKQPILVFHGPSVKKKEERKNG